MDPTQEFKCSRNDINDHVWVVSHTFVFNMKIHVVLKCIVLNASALQLHAETTAVIEGLPVCIEKTFHSVCKHHYFNISKCLLCI